MGKNRRHELKSNGESIPAEMPQEVAIIIKDLPEPKRRALIKYFSFSISQHSGPLPDGETLKVYNEQIPNGGDRLMATVERQLEHRITIETTGVRRSFNQSNTGQWMAFGIAVIFGLIAWDLGKNNHDALAGTVAGGDILGLVAVFILGKSKQRN